MALRYNLKSDMSYYTNFSSESYPFYWPTHTPTNNTSRSGQYFDTTDHTGHGSNIIDQNHQNSSSQDDSTIGYEDAMLDLAANVISSDATQKWIMSIIGCLLVGLSGIFPLLLIPTTAKTPKSISSSDNALSTENSTAKITEQDSNIQQHKPIANGANGGVNCKVLVTNGATNGHHKVNGICKMNGDYKSEPIIVVGNGHAVIPKVEKSSTSTSSGSAGQDDVNNTGISQKILKRLLSFAVGSLLGDVFLHLLPEAWENAQSYCQNDHDMMMKIGTWVLIGIISFLGCEMLVACAGGDDDEGYETGYDKDTANVLDNVSSNNNDAQAQAKMNCHANHLHKTEINSSVTKSAPAVKNCRESQKQIAGYLNLVANCFDNFTHGLAVAGSFIVSTKIGIITTAAILLHEIPHEIGDFAILLRSGFNPWSAAKAQLSTALVGLLGAIFTLSCDSMILGDFTWWILPFTSGCFIQIAMSNILPDLLKEKDPVESCLHFIFIIFGIGLMGFVTFIAGV